MAAVVGIALFVSSSIVQDLLSILVSFAVAVALL